MANIDNNKMTDEQAREVLGLDAGLWTIQFSDEELRMLQEIMNAESKRREDIFGGLHDKIASHGGS